LSENGGQNVRQSFFGDTSFAIRVSIAEFGFYLMVIDADFVFE